MRLQSTKASCGPAALGNALEALGIKRSDDELKVLCKTTAEGTSAKNIIAAIRALGIEPVSFKTSAALAPIVLSHHLTSGRAAIICVDADAHWVGCIGLLGRRFVVADSAMDALVVSYAEDELLARWVSPDGRYYGIVV